jgi:hypothetical protein
MSCDACDEFDSIYTTPPYANLADVEDIQDRICAACVFRETVAPATANPNLFCTFGWGGVKPPCCDQLVFFHHDMVYISEECTKWYFAGSSQYVTASLYYKIYEQTLTQDEPVVQILDIPSGYEELLVEIVAREGAVVGGSNASNVSMWFNDDGNPANYSGGYHYGVFGAAPSAGAAIANTPYVIGFFRDGNAGYTAQTFGRMTVSVKFQPPSAFHNQTAHSYGETHSGAAFSPTVFQGYQHWSNTDPITKIGFWSSTAGATGFIKSSVFKAWVRKDYKIPIIPF